MLAKLKKCTSTNLFGVCSHPSRPETDKVYFEQKLTKEKVTGRTAAVKEIKLVEINRTRRAHLIT